MFRNYPVIQPKGEEEKVSEAWIGIRERIPEMDVDVVVLIPPRQSKRTLIFLEDAVGYSDPIAKDLDLDRAKYVAKGLAAYLKSVGRPSSKSVITWHYQDQIFDHLKVIREELLDRYLEEVIGIDPN